MKGKQKNMNDPYEFLGVSHTSTEEEINEAYKSLLTQIEARRNIEPSFDADTEIERLNNAYDAIMDMRKSDFTQQSAYNNNSSQYPEVRELIRDGRFDIAESKLQNIPSRNAEWNFLMGTIEYSKGHLNQAYTYFSGAVQLNPENPEYSAAFARMNEAKKGRMPGDEAYRTSNEAPNTCGCCNICNGLICADCCCECFGGDLIPCC